MAQKTIAPYATQDLTVPIGQKIAISTTGGGYVTISYKTTGTLPPVFYVHDRINNEEVLLGTFSDARVVRIETKDSPALYNIGASPSVGTGDASSLNGYTEDDADTADTLALRDSNGDIQANAFESTVATGTAPLTVASTTKVANLNVESIDGLDSTQFLRSDATDYTTGNLGIGVSPTKVLHAKTTSASDKIVALIEAAGLTGDPAIAFLITGTEQYVIGIDADDNKLKIGDGASVDVNTILTIDRPNGIISTSLLPSYAQTAQSAKTTDATLTTAELKTRIITVNNGAAGTTTLTLPLATGMDSDFAMVGNNYDIEFSVINISTNAAEDCTIATNTGWTLVGSMVVESNDADRAASSGIFRARKTGTGAWTLYRIA